jgi:hypothetical protein
MGMTPTREEEKLADMITNRIDSARTRLMNNPRIFMSVVRDIVLDEVMKKNRQTVSNEEEW